MEYNAAGGRLQEKGCTGKPHGALFALFKDEVDEIVEPMQTIRAEMESVKAG